MFSSRLKSLKNQVANGLSYAHQSMPSVRGFFGSSSTEKKSEAQSLVSSASSSAFSKIAGVLVLLDQLKTAGAKTLYEHEQSTGIDYRLTYDENHFPGMAYYLQKHCPDVYAVSSPALDFIHNVTPYCKQSGISVDLSVEMGWELSKSFLNCFTDAMEEMCRDYENPKPQPIDVNYEFNPTIAAITLGAIGLIAVGVGIAACVRSRNRTYRSDLNDPFLGQGSVAILVNDSHHHRPHHDHHHDHHHDDRSSRVGFAP